MKLTAIFFITAILLLLATEIQSQDLQIYQGNKIKTFKVGHLVKIDLPTNNPECSTCPKNYIVGRLVSYKNDTLRLHLKVENRTIAGNDKEIGRIGIVYKDKMEEDWPTMEILSNSILSITKQGTKKWQPKNAGDLYGATFVSVGTFFMLAAWAAEEESNQDALLGSGITMASIGLVMVTVFDRKTYEIENPLNTIIKHKPWDIK